MSEITLESVSSDGDTVYSTVSYPNDLRRFFTDEDFFVQYDEDVSTVPESILAIPVLAQVCPIAWANGVAVEAPVLDRDFRDALDAVKRSLQSMYPDFMEGGQINVDETVSNRGSGAGKSAVLFSGGIDSLTSYIRHRDERPTLIGVQGWVIGVDQPTEWDESRRNVETFADRYGTDARFVRSNMLEFLDTPMLHAHYKRYLVGSWYSGVGHGLGLLGLCAPLAWTNRIGDLYIASTHTEEFSHPWGSHPTIDSQVRWGDTVARHDGFELSRQEKIEAIAEFVDEGHPDLPVFTCNRGAAKNCSRCEKCCRTAVGMVLAGMDPNRHGYDVDGETFALTREHLASGDWLVDEDVLFMWKDIQRHVPDAIEADWDEAEDFFTWLRDADLDGRFERVGTPVTHRLLRTVARHTPYPVYSRTYPIYKSLKPYLG